MKNTLYTSAEKLRSLEQEAFVRRVMWIDFEERLSSCFHELETQTRDLDRLGNLYLSTSAKTNAAYKKPHIRRPNSINSAQISTGWRNLGVFHTFKSDNPDTANIGMEAGASICFSQGLTGTVMVLMYPYSSDLAKTDEENIIVAFNLEPTDLTKEKIRDLISLFIKYCVATSAISTGSIKSYLFRMRLHLLDFRFRKIQQQRAFLLIERGLIIVLAALGVMATLYTGNKLIF